MSMSTTASESPAEVASTITESIDRLSLEQALLDVEVANARVIDLTERLTAATAELRFLRQQMSTTAVAPSRHTGLAGSIRRMVAGPVKAIARAVLPLEVRVRLRAMLR
jgi:hypothetical protein